MFELNTLPYTPTVLRKRMKKLMDREDKRLRQIQSAKVKKPNFVKPGERLIKKGDETQLIRTIPIFDCSDPPEIEEKYEYMPEETYEIWNQAPYLHAELHTKKLYDNDDDSGNKVGANNHGNNHDSNESINNNDNDNNSNDNNNNNDDDDLYDDNEDDNVSEEDNRPRDDDSENIAHSNGIPPQELLFLVKTAGLEILPHYIPDINTLPKSEHLGFSPSYTRRHVSFVTRLLHINVLKRRWKIAYKCFGLLIRHHTVDIRSIWPLGVEILTRLREEELKQKLDGAFDEYAFRTNTFATKIMEPFKDEQFLIWLESFYPVNVAVRPNTAPLPLPFRLGTRHTAPFHVLDLIWVLITRKKFDEVNDKLQRLLYRKPYIEEGIYYFLQGFSYQLEAMELSKNFSENIDKQKIELLLLDAQKSYNEAKLKHIEFPEKILKTQIEMVKVRLSEDIEKEAHPNISEDHPKDDEMPNGENSFDMFDVERVRNPDSDFEDEDDFNMARFDELED